MYLYERELERCKERDDKENQPRRGLLREFSSEYPIFNKIVQRLLERKLRSNENANENTVLDTLIASLKSFNIHSRF